MLSWKRAAPICKCYDRNGQLQYVNVIMEKGNSNMQVLLKRAALIYKYYHEKGQLQYINAIMEKGSSNM